MPIKVFYSPHQSAARNPSFSPSAQKPALVVDAWRNTGLPIEVVEPRPASVSELCLAHDPAYVEGVLSGRVPNGFGNTDPAVTHALPWTSGSVRSAAELAGVEREPAFSPTSGFHHAGWDYGGAFCTFNGLLVAALSLRARGLVERVAIIDCDQHFGDGTRDIIRRLDLSWVAHYTYGEDPAWPGTAEAWLHRLPLIVDRTARGADVVLYQAGADPHVDDPLGGGLTTEQLGRRDRIVYEVCRELDIPVVTVLAGGYQRPVVRVVDLHVQTLREFAAVWGIGDEPSIEDSGGY